MVHKNVLAKAGREPSWGFKSDIVDMKLDGESNEIAVVKLDNKSDCAIHIDFYGKSTNYDTVADDVSD